MEQAVSTDPEINSFSNPWSFKDTCRCVIISFQEQLKSVKLIPCDQEIQASGISKTTNSDCAVIK